MYVNKYEKSGPFLRPHILRMKSHKFCVLKHGPLSNCIAFNQIQLSCLLNRVNSMQYCKWAVSYQSIAAFLQS